MTGLCLYFLVTKCIFGGSSYSFVLYHMNSYLFREEVIGIELVQRGDKIKVRAIEAVEVNLKLALC